MKRKISAESKNVKIKKKKNIEAPLEKKVFFSSFQIFIVLNVDTYNNLKVFFSKLPFSFTPLVILYFDVLFNLFILCIYKEVLSKVTWSMGCVVQYSFENIFVFKVLTADEREKRKTSLYRAPTSEELSELRENEDLYKNNLFRMQVLTLFLNKSILFILYISINSAVLFRRHRLFICQCQHMSKI